MTHHLTYSQFRSRARGIPCIVDVTHYLAEVLANLSGSCFGGHGAMMLALKR